MLSSYFYRLTLHILYIHHALPLALRAEHNEVFRLGVRSDFRSGFSSADGAEYPCIIHLLRPHKILLSALRHSLQTHNHYSIVRHAYRIHNYLPGNTNILLFGYLLL